MNAVRWRRGGLIRVDCFEVSLIAPMNSPDSNLTPGSTAEPQGSADNTAPHSRPATPSLSTAPKVRRILLADDDPGVREMLGRVLQLERYEVFHARTGNEAAREFVRECPDLVLLDLGMPERDGWSAFRFMTAAQPLLPVIIITARSNQYQQAAALHVDALMEKPLNLPVLLAAMERLLNETAAERNRRMTQPGFKTALLAERTAPGIRAES